MSIGLIWLPALSGAPSSLAPASQAPMGVAWLPVLGSGAAAAIPPAPPAQTPFGLAWLNYLNGSSAEPPPPPVASPATCSASVFFLLCSPQSAPLPYDLYEAAVLWLTANAPLPGGYHAGQAPNGTAVKGSYALITEVGTSSGYASDNSEVGDGMMQIMAVAGTRKAAKLAGDAIKTAMNDSPLVFQDGVLLYLNQSDRQAAPDPSPAPRGNNAFLDYRVFEYLVQPN